VKGNGSHNPYIPYPVKIEKITIENAERDLKTFRLGFLNKEDEQAFQYLPGQFAEISVFGKGESPIGIASSPTERGYLLFTVKKTGVVTSDLHDSEEGRTIGVRGPLGKPYPLEEMEGKNVVIVGGGFAFTTLRSTICYLLDAQNRKRFKNITAVYGARSPGELIYKEELRKWEASGDIDMVVTVDKGDEAWTGREGFVPTVL
jgi:sulfhydrogenase subunit gamma (sulfur reductase)